MDDDINARYEAAGCAAYWTVEPETPTVTAWARVSGQYVETAHVRRDAVLEVEHPFPIRLLTSELLA